MELQTSQRRSRSAEAETFAYVVPQVLLRQRRRSLLEPLQRSIGGRLYPSPTDNLRRRCWYWELRSRANLEKLLQRLGPQLPAGPSGRRLGLLPLLLRLRSSGAYRSSSPLHLRWERLLQRWETALPPPPVAPPPPPSAPLNAHRPATHRCSHRRAKRWEPRRLRLLQWRRRQRRFDRPDYPQGLERGWVLKGTAPPEERRDSRGRRLPLLRQGAAPVPAAAWPLNPAAFSRQRLRWQWLAGLIDGDGHLANRGRAYLSIAGHSGEEELLRQARALLGHGRLRRIPGKHCTVLDVTGRPALRRLVAGLGGYLRHPRKRSRIRTLCLRWAWPLPRQQPLLANPGWVLGLIDSDGYFNLEQMRRRLPRRGSLEVPGYGTYCSPVLKVVNQQRPLLTALRRQFGGRVSPMRMTPRHRRRCWVWHLTNRWGLEALVEHCRHLPTVGPKGRRLALLPRFYRLREAGASHPASPLHPQWLELLALFGRQPSSF